MKTGSQVTSLHCWKWRLSSLLFWGATGCPLCQDVRMWGWHTASLYGLEAASGCVSHRGRRPPTTEMTEPVRQGLLALLWYNLEEAASVLSVQSASHLKGPTLQFSAFTEVVFTNIRIYSRRVVSIYMSQKLYLTLVRRLLSKWIQKKTKYMLMSRYQKAGQKSCIKIENWSFENVPKFKYLETTLTDQHLMHEEIKSRINMGNSYYYSVQSILSSRLVSRTIKVKIYKTIILSIVLYGCKAWSLTLRE
jgi:hypothetical protein